MKDQHNLHWSYQRLSAHPDHWAGFGLDWAGDFAGHWQYLAKQSLPGILPTV